MSEGSKPFECLCFWCGEFFTIEMPVSLQPENWTGTFDQWWMAHPTHSLCNDCVNLPSAQKAVERGVASFKATGSFRTAP